MLRNGPGAASSIPSASSSTRLSTRTTAGARPTSAFSSCPATSSSTACAGSSATRGATVRANIASATTCTRPARQELHHRLVGPPALGAARCRRPAHLRLGGGDRPPRARPPASADHPAVRADPRRSQDIDDTSRQLREALEAGRTIIVTTLQKFPSSPSRSASGPPTRGPRHSCPCRPRLPATGRWTPPTKWPDSPDEWEVGRVPAPRRRRPSGEMTRVKSSGREQGYHGVDSFSTMSRRARTREHSSQRSLSGST